MAQSWYEGLEVNGNTTLNPYFYGTYLGETKPEEPVHRNKNQVFQADAVGAMHQMTPSHFQTLHTFRLEWQPGPGGRLDWFAKDYRVNSTFSMSGDGNGQDWVHAFSIKDESLNLTGAQIPVEPSHLIMNTAISSTWGFPFDVPPGCSKCYDCTNATCACSFNPGFCNMMKESNVAMYIDHVRVYQSKNDTAHVGLPHTVGCDPVEYPTKEYIKGNAYRYMRAAPFGYDDTAPLKKTIKKGGGNCTSSSDCGALLSEGGKDNADQKGGVCLKSTYQDGIFSVPVEEGRCKCFDGYTGPYCLAVDKFDDEPGAWEIRKNSHLFKNLPVPTLPPCLVITIAAMLLTTIIFGITNKKRKEQRDGYMKL